MTRDEIIRDIEERAVGEDCRYIAIRCDVAREIVRMLREQEPRVMTLEEIKDNIGVPVWVEYANDENRNGYGVTTSDYKTYIMIFGANDFCSHYARSNNVTWRCWTSRPDEQVRRDTPWDVSPEVRKKWELDDEIASGIGQTFSPD